MKVGDVARSDLRASGNPPRRLRSRINLLAALAADRYTPSGFLFSAVGIGAALLLVSAVIAYYFEIDVFASLSFIANDNPCANNDHAGTGVGIHCFGDYYQVVDFAQATDPWANNRSNYAAAGMLPNLLFGTIADAVGAPRFGLILFLLVILACLLVPAAWASRGKALWIRVATLILFGLGSLPALMALDRANNTALAVPALLAFLVGVRRDNYRVAVIAIIVAALIRPQYLLLIAVLLARRQWKASLVAFGGVGVTNLLAYLAWPTIFPGSIGESLASILRFGRGAGLDAEYPANVSFGKIIYELGTMVRRAVGMNGDAVATSLSGLAGSVIALLLIVAVVIAGRRMPVAPTAILVLALASLLPSTTFSYYLVFCLPVAAILLRDPLDLSPDRYTWRGVLDDEVVSRRGVVATALIALAVAFSLTRFLLPELLGFEVNHVPRVDLVGTTAGLAPLAWLAASLAALLAWGDQRTTST